MIRTSMIVLWWCDFHTTALKPFSMWCVLQPGPSAVETAMAPSGSADRRYRGSAHSSGLFRHRVVVRVQHPTGFFEKSMRGGLKISINWFHSAPVAWDVWMLGGGITATDGEPMRV